MIKIEKHNITKAEQQKADIKRIWIDCVLMPNGEIIFYGNCIARLDDGEVSDSIYMEQANT